MNHKTQWILGKGNPQPLGVTILYQGVNFALEIKRGQKVRLVLVHKKTGKETFLSTDHIERYGNVLALRLEHFDYAGYWYYYEIDEKKQMDPYAVSIMSNQRRRFGVWDESRLYCGFPADEFDWQEEKCPRIPLNEVILYLAHLRGFTKHSSSKVQEKGTFRGLAEKIPYLKELGINQLELMPVYEFQEMTGEEQIHPRYCEEKKPVINYWGYSDTNYYFAVKQSYAATSDGADELKQLVRSLHENGLELILEFYFPKECRMSFVTDCLKYWVSVYHVDGFHLTGSWTGTMELLKEPLLADRKIYSSVLDVDEVKVQQAEGENGHAGQDLRRAALCGVDYLTNMRCFLKSDSGKVMDAAYYMRRNHEKAGYINGFTYHDGFTMMDLVSYEQKHNEANEEGNQDGWDYNFSWNCGVEGKTKKKIITDLRKRQMKNAWVMLLFSQGIPAILAGDERCNSQKGNNNVYCQDNETGWVKWKIPKVYEELYTFVRKLIQFRKEHPVFHMQKPVTMTDTLECGFPDLSYHSDKVWLMDSYRMGYAVGMLYCGAYAGGDDYFYIADNMGWNGQRFAIPDIPKDRAWHILIDTSKENSIDETSQVVQKRVLEVPARTIVVLIGRIIKGKEKNVERTKKKSHAKEKQYNV